MKKTGTSRLHPLRRNAANLVSILGVLPVALLFLENGHRYLIPLVIYNNIMDDLDGILAAKLGIKSEWGAVLDNVCDAVSHTIFALAVGFQAGMLGGGVYGALAAVMGLAAATAILLRVVSRLCAPATLGSGSPTNELMRHLLLILLLAGAFDFEPAPFLIAAFSLHAVSMLVPFQLPWLIRSWTKSAAAIGLLNAVLVLAWLVPYATPVVAACFFLTYLCSLVSGARRWQEGRRPAGREAAQASTTRTDPPAALDARERQRPVNK